MQAGTGYQTPKLDTRSAVFRDGKILLVREANGRWALPGGWVDYAQTIRTNAAKEVLEEAGMIVEPVRVIALFDHNRRNGTFYPSNICSAFVLYRYISGEKKCKELDDNSPEKSYLKNPKTIAGLVREGRYSTPYLPEGVYAEIREAQVCRDQIMKQHVRLSNQIQGWLQKYFPEYLECYKDFDTASGMMVLEHVPLPEDVIKLGAGGINEIWRKAKLRAAGIKRAKTLVEAAQGSVGLSGGEAARLEIWFLINDYQTKTKQLERLDDFLAKEIQKVPHVEKLLAIKGVGLSTVIGFVADVGDIGRFTDPKQVPKLAGLEITKASSGKRNGQPCISKRGWRRLRRTMYESARSLISWNEAFSEIFMYYRYRTRNPLGSMQAKIAVSCKTIRVFYTILTTGCDFDAEKLRRDIILPEAV